MGGRWFLQRSQRGDGLLLAALINLTPLLWRLAPPVVRPVVPVVRPVVRQVARPVLHARVLVVGARRPAGPPLHRGSRSVLVLLLGSCKEVDISVEHVSLDWGLTKIC